MKRYLYSVIGVIAFYVLFFYGESIRVADRKILDFQPFFSILIVLLPLTLLLIPFLRRRLTTTILGIGFGLYTILTLINASNLDFMERGVILSFIIEVLCMLTILLLTINLAHQHEALENLIKALVTPPTQHKPINFNEDISAIEDEFYRGRRFDYPISALMFSIGSEMNKVDDDAHFRALLSELQQWIKHRYVLYRFTKLIDDLIRKSDMIVQMDGTDKLLLICPDTPAENLTVLISRLQKRFKESLGIDVVCGVASFPKDATTFRALITKTEESLASTSQTPKMLSN